MARLLLVVVGGVCICDGASSNGRAALPAVRVTLTSLGGDRLTSRDDIVTASWRTVDSDHPAPPESSFRWDCASAPMQQRIDGFGGTFNRAGAVVLNSMPPTTQAAILGALFDPVNGVAFNLAKVPIAANDFAVPVWYSYLGSPTAVFNLSHDMDPAAGLVPLVRRANAVAGKPLRVQSTMDYPPQWMLDNANSSSGINASYFDALAQYFLSFATAMSDSGVPIEIVSLFNEPFESYCKVTIPAIRELLINHVGPLFRRTPGAPKLTWGEQYGRVVTRDVYSVLAKDPLVRPYIDMLFYHGYDCMYTCDGLNTTCPGLADAMIAIAEYKAMFPELSMWMTEVCYAVEFGNYPSGNGTTCPRLPRTDLVDGLQWGRMLFGDLLAGASGWIYWNFLLDAAGGPWLVSEDHNDPPNNYQQPLIVADNTTGTFTPTACYYFMAHFSKFVTGLRLIKATTAPLDTTLYGAAFVSDARSNVVVVLMNDNVTPRNVTVVIDGAAVTVALPAVSIATLSIELPSSAPRARTDDNLAPETKDALVAAAVLVLAAGLATAFAVVARARRRRRRALEAVAVDEATAYIESHRALYDA